MLFANCARQEEQGVEGVWTAESLAGESTVLEKLHTLQEPTEAPPLLTVSPELSVHKT